jgi:hypothetical protein
MSMPGFTADASLYRTSQQYRMNSPECVLTGQVTPQQMGRQARPAGDSEELLICLGACLCCGLCDEGPWQRASCSYCRRCVGSPGPVIVA